MYAVRRPLLGVLCCIAVAGGCGKSPSSSDAFDPVGTLRFTYRGPVSGTFQATGEMQPQSGAIPQPVTGATAYVQQNALSLLAFQARTTTSGDGFALSLGQVDGTGTVQLDPLSCQGATLAGCRAGVFAPNLDEAQLQASPDLASLAQQAYVLVLGSVTITSRTKVRVKGTFQGVAFRSGDQALQNALTITGGQFDVPVRPEQQP